jgi:hypothetical protein
VKQGSFLPKSSLEEVFFTKEIAYENRAEDGGYIAQYEPFSKNSASKLLKHLPPRGAETVEVELKLFNDRALNRDLEMLCTKVT